MLNVKFPFSKIIFRISIILIVLFSFNNVKAQNCGWGIPPIDPQNWQIACATLDFWCEEIHDNCPYQVCYCVRIYYDPVLLKDIYQIQIYSIVPVNPDCCPYFTHDIAAFSELLWIALDKIVTENPNNLPFVYPDCDATNYCQNYYSIFECYLAMCWNKDTGYSCLYPGSAWCQEEERVCRNNQGQVVICHRECTIIGSVTTCPGDCSNIYCLCP